MVQAILRLPAVKARTGLSRSSIYAYIADNRFPSAIPLGARAVGWLESEIAEWLQSRVDASRNKAGVAR